MVGDAILYSPKTCTAAHSTDEPRNVREMVKVYNKFKARVPGPGERTALPKIVGSGTTWVTSITALIIDACQSS